MYPDPKLKKYAKSYGKSEMFYLLPSLYDRRKKEVENIGALSLKRKKKKKVLTLKGENGNVCCAVLANFAACI